MNLSKKKVLFVCTQNAARSQMAEGLLRALYGDRYEVFSAGAKPHTVNPYAVKVMAEIGIDISTHYSKNLKKFLDTPMDHVVTLCANAEKLCPVFPGAGIRLHKGFDDPAAVKGLEEEKIKSFRRIRDEIKAWLEEYFGRKKLNGLREIKC